MAAMFPTESLRAHPDADLIPWADTDSHEALVADIEGYGIQVPLDVMPDGTVLDGRTRLAIARALNLHEVPVRWVAPADPVTYMVRMALVRRHLTTAQRKVLAASLIKVEPTRSDRSVAQATGISHHTVGAVRDDMEGRGQIAHVPTRTDTLGRQQPATKPFREQVGEDQAAMEAHLEQVVAEATASEVAAFVGEHSADSDSTLAPAFEAARRATNPPPPSDDRWRALDGIARSIRDMKAAPARDVAAAVPEHRRAGTARTLRELGTYLGSIALALEEMSR